jgi:hypothetical protein
MPDATITSTASTFGTISGTFAADQSTVTGTVTGIVAGTLTGSVGVPGPAGAAGVGVPVGGTAGQFLTKIDGTNYNTDWTTVNLSVYAVKANNLSDLADAGTARTNLGLGSLAVVNDAPSNGSQYARKNAAWEVVTTTPDFISSVSSPLSVTTGNLTIDLSAYLTTATASATYQTLSGMSSYLTTATAASTYYLQTNPSGFQTAANVTTALSPYLLSATAASTYAVIAAGQPTAGTTGQVLTKNSGTNYDSSWATLILGDRYLTTSTTSNTLSNTNKTFTIGTGLSYTPTQNITISYDASNHMHGEVLTYNSGTGVLTVDINHHTGSGTYAAWVVNVGGVTPATSVAWGAITGTLSSQTDLQSALDLKLAATTAASTYQTLSGMSSYLTTSAAASNYAALAGATFTNVVGFNGNPGNVSAKSTGYFKAYTSGFENTDYSLQYESGFQVVVGGTTVASIAASGILAPSAGITFSDATTQTSAGITAATAASTYAPLASPALTGNPTAPTPLTADNDTSIATTAFVKAQGYLTSAPVTSVAGRTGAITLAVADVSGAAPLASPTFSGSPSLPTGTIGVTQSAGNSTTALATTAFVTTADNLKADLASPTFTGTPTLPTGTIATTQTPGNNTTALATTAFVTAAVPAFATETQAIAGTSSTTALSPLLMRYILANPMLTTYNSLVGNYSSFVSGSGSVSTVWSNLFAVQITAANGKAAFQPNSQVSYHSIQSRGQPELNVDWTKPMWFSFRFCYSSSGTIGNSNTVNRVTIGKVSSTFGDLSARGIGVKWTAGTAGAFTVMAHNGSSLSTSASAVTVSNATYFPTTSSAADFMVYSDGTGNVTLFCNNVQVATTTGGPSSGTSPGPRFVFECDNTTSTSGTVTCDFTGVKSMLAY